MKLFNGSIDGADMTERTITLKVDCSYDEMKGLTVGDFAILRIGDMPKSVKSRVRKPLRDADPNCVHDVICEPGGDCRCTKCDGWTRL